MKKCMILGCVVLALLLLTSPAMSEECGNSVFWGNYSGTIYYSSGQAVLMTPEVGGDFNNFNSDYLYIPACNSYGERFGVDEDTDYRYDVIIVKKDTRTITYINHGIWNYGDFSEGWGTLILMSFSADYKTASVVVHHLDNDPEEIRGLGTGTFTRIE